MLREVHEEAFTWPVVQCLQQGRGSCSLLESSNTQVAGALGERAEESLSGKGPPGEAGLRNRSSLNSVRFCSASGPACCCQQRCSAPPCPWLVAPLPWREPCGARSPFSSSSRPLVPFSTLSLCRSREVPASRACFDGNSALLDLPLLLPLPN